MSKKVITFYDSEKQSHDFPIITPDYGICSTASNTSAKVVICDDFSLFTGAEITVKFTNVPTTDTITLNVNNSGAKNVDFSACGNKPYDEIKANGCYGFVYDGTSWIYKGSGKGASKEELERLQYYGDKDIVPSESYFTVNETGETITGLTDAGKTQTELVIPYKINGKEITALYSGVDSGRPQSILNDSSTITKIIIPKSIATLGRGAFSYCSSLTSIDIPNSVTSIGDYAFNACSSLTKVEIPNSVTSIGSDAFYECSSLTSIDIPNSVTSIEGNVFYGCTNLTIYCEQGSYAETYAKENNIPVIYTDVKADSLVNNILDDAAIGSLHQKFDGDSYFDFTGKNPNATLLDSTLTGNITKGATGNYASSFGGKSAAMGKRSLAEGTTTIAKGNYSHVEGDNSVALGNDSHAEGYMTVSKGDQSHAEGIRTISKGTSSHTEGYETESTGAYSHAEGEITKSTGEASHTEGFKTESAGLYSHAEGNNSKVLTSLPSTSSTGGSSSTESTGVTSDNNWNVDEHFGEAAHVEGADNIAIGFASHAEGVNNKAHGHYAHTEGIKNIAGLETEEGVILAPHAEGYNTKAFGNYSHTEGYTTEASGSNSHAEGDQTVASGTSSHAEGHNTKASNDYSHSEGSDTIATGASSHSEGGGTKASGDYSHAEGEGTIASKRNQHVQGKFNIEDTTNNYAHIIGNGGDTNFRSNAHTVDWNGNAWYAGNIKIGGDSYDDASAKELATKAYVDDSVSLAGSGDMLKSVYDKDNDGVIDDIALLQYYGTTDITISDSSYFTVNKTGETITGLSDTGKTQTELVIPYKINGVEIIAIGNGAFSETPLTNVIIPNSVTSIGSNAFYYCDSLTNISIPNSVTSIGDSAFSYCALTNISIPNGVTSIDASTFNYCESLKNVTIPNSVTSIDNSAFHQCVSLTSINIPNSVTSIGDGVFHIYDSETSSSIPIPGLTLYCEQGSYAETYAKENNIPVIYTDIDPSKYLTKDNITEYTPAADYQPATKKYVDDAINASSSGEATNVSTVKTCTGDELISITSPAVGSIRYVSIAGTGDNVSITPGLYFYLDSWKKVAIEDTAIISNEFVSGGDSTSIK